MMYFFKRNTQKYTNTTPPGGALSQSRRALTAIYSNSHHLANVLGLGLGLGLDGHSFPPHDVSDVQVVQHATQLADGHFAIKPFDNDTFCRLEVTIHLVGVSPQIKRLQVVISQSPCFVCRDS